MPKQVLIVDDSTMSRMVLRKCMEMGGHEGVHYYEAANGVEALEILNANEIDLILTDLIMPEMDGEQLVINIKKSSKLRDIPIIVISSIANPASESKLLSLGASSILSKPLSPIDLDQAVNNVYTHNGNKE